MRSHWLAIAAVAAAATANAAPAGKSGPPKPPVWVGVFLPNVKLPCKSGCEALAPTPRGGFVRVLTPSDGSPPAKGSVTIVHPLAKAIASGVVVNGIVPVGSFSHDENRDNDDSVIVLPGDAKPAMVQPTPADALAIRAALLAQADELAKVRKSLDHLEIGLVDIDGDGKPDLAATFGCNNWADGSCQSRGQFFLAKRGTRWVVID
jgi:hypothetical protein